MMCMKKTMVLALIGLFIGACAVPSIVDEHQNRSMRIDDLRKGFHPPNTCDVVIDFECDTDDGFDEDSSHSYPRYGQSNENKKWTFMFYDDADFQGYDPLTESYGGISFAEAAYSGENVDVIVIRDTYYGPATMWYIDEHHQLEKLEDMGEINMGDAASLHHLVDYGKNKFPADRYVLALYNHGGGMWGACIDDTSNGDLLTMDEMQRALHETGGVDLLCFTAPCYMGALESAYELKDCVDVYVGSEEKSGYTCWHDPMAVLFETLHENPDISTNDLGSQIIDWIEASAKTNIRWGFLITMSAIRTDSMQELGASLDQLSMYFNDHFNDTIKDIMKARRRTKEVGSHRQTIDLLDFIQRYADIEKDPIISEHLTTITEALNEAILKECHRWWYRRDQGLSIYFPEISLFYGYTHRYDEPGYGLDFPQDNHWDEFLRNYYAYELELFRIPFVQFS